MKKQVNCICLLLAAALMFSACADTGVRPSDQPLPGEAQAGEPDETIDNSDASSTSLIDALLPVTVITGGSISDIDLSIPATLQVTRPDGDLTTSYSTYFITGTSDPKQPLYMESDREPDEDEDEEGDEEEEDDGEIERQGELGTWGVLVELEDGENTFTFIQGEDSVPVTITRAEGSVSTITDIVQSSMYPAVLAGIDAGLSLPVECIAPSGGTVVAHFAGREVTLQQVNPASQGIPAVYRGLLPVEGDYEPGETANMGGVTYTLTYDDETTTHQSAGDVYVAGAGARLAIEVTNYIGFVYPNTARPSQFKEMLKQGATDYVESESDGYFELASGGFLPKEQATILEGEADIRNRLQSVDFTATGRGETYDFRGTAAPVFNTWVEDNTFYITLYNTSGAQEADASGSALFSAVSADADDGALTYAFRMSDPLRFWGYNVSFSGDTLHLRFQYKPQIDPSGAEPLAGVLIVLDPGHGGDDTGALGVASGVGPNEADINLAQAYAARDALKALGATVLLTHAGDGAELDERLEYFEMSGADLFLSIHHNSVGEDVDSNDANGMEVYYHTGISGEPAAAMMEALDAGIDRQNRRVMQSYYRVTLIPQAPSMLLELGFMSNPAEYESLTDPAELERVALAIADGVVEIFR